ncbi:Polynucleotidyl transferase [Metarhizium album ARSEF 1941]|uniref:Polynucleotidyl transferase n=1 Tax=Metarhizium album (strain ARSEF 1941) TaxID=1081103 RepID=A0A0B2WN95_METAS|nr:Polynucleotidyl transferase [Metarhizium album ARSEF 1941]KHN94480.1 Polynucleotidyl transferase [Metarhizium album ARSEF 1941]
MEDQVRKREPTYQIVKNGLEILLQILGPKEEAPLRYQDTILVAIDFENNIQFRGDLSRNVDTQLGLAILDTRDISTATSPEKLISTYNFVTGSPKYYRKAMLKFLFRKPVWIKLDEVLDQIKALIPTDRNVILVGHDIRHEVHVLSNIGFNLQGLQCLDTFRITGQVLPHFSLTLGELLTELGCPYSWLHNGGNDANFTLRALLLLGIKASQDQAEAKGGRDEKLQLMEEVARSPIPSISPGEAELVAQEKASAAEKRAVKTAKRFKNTRKYQSRFWSAEKQAEIRAERTAMRLAKAELSLEHNDNVTR